MTTLDGTFAATGQSATLEVYADLSNVSLSGFGVGSVNLERSFDNGSNWHIVATYTADVEAVLEEAESGTSYRFNCTAYTSGTIAYHMGFRQGDLA